MKRHPWRFLAQLSGYQETLLLPLTSNHFQRGPRLLSCTHHYAAATARLSSTEPRSRLFHSDSAASNGHLDALRVFVVAGEPSGDAIGSRLIAAMREVIGGRQHDGFRNGNSLGLGLYGSEAGRHHGGPETKGIEGVGAVKFAGVGG